MPTIKELRTKFDHLPARSITHSVTKKEALEDFHKLQNAFPTFGSSKLGVKANKFASDFHLLNTTRYKKEKYKFNTVWKTPSFREKLYERIAKRCPKTQIGSIGTGHIRSMYQTYYNCITYFRPMIAKYIFSKYSKKGRVLDFCAGWGGRLIGALATPSVISYTGIDTNSDLIPSYKKIIQTLCPKGVDARVINKPAEKVDFKKIGKFDCVLTSPPYYQVERYPNMPSYPSYESWLNTFLFPVLENITKSIDPLGYICINIRQQPTEKRMVKKMKHLGWHVVKKLHMPVPAMPGKGYDNRLSGEPIYIFKKRI